MMSGGTRTIQNGTCTPMYLSRSSTNWICHACGLVFGEDSAGCDFLPACAAVSEFLGALVKKIPPTGLFSRLYSNSSELPENVSLRRNDFIVDQIVIVAGRT